MLGRSPTILPKQSTPPYYPDTQWTRLWHFWRRSKRCSAALSSLRKCCIRGCGSDTHDLVTSERGLLQTYMILQGIFSVVLLLLVTIRQHRTITAPIGITLTSTSANESGNSFGVLGITLETTHSSTVCLCCDNTQRWRPTNSLQARV